MLAPYVPDLEVEVGQVDGRDVLAYRRHGAEVRVPVLAVEGFYLFEEGCLACVVEAEEQDRVFWGEVSVGEG